MHPRCPSRLSPLIALLMAAAPVVACEQAATVEQTQRRIYNGLPDTDPAHRSVVALVEPVGGGRFESFCTGTLINPATVLTAAHCVDALQPADFEIYFGTNVLGGGTQVAVDDFVQHDGWDKTDAESPDDIALVFLASAAPSNVEPSVPLPASLKLTASDVGTDLVFSGFGETESFDYDEKLWVAAPLGRVCAGPQSCAWAGDILAPRTIGYDQAEGGPCNGDSGGPAFLERGGTEYIVGINAYGDLDCWGSGVSTLVDAYEHWIAENGGEDGVEICDVPGDEDGNGLENCDDPACADAMVCAQGCECTQSSPATGLPLLWLTLLGLVLLRRRAVAISR